MTQPDYDQKKRECFVQFCKDNGIDQEVTISIFDAFDQIFDRAYALGKQFGNSEQVDAEEEEVLTVSRKRVREMYAANERIKADFPDKETAHISDHINHVLRHLFGSKCLPDNVESSEPNVDSLHDNVDSLPQNPTENCDNKSHISADCNKPAEAKFTKGDMVHCKSFGYEGDYKVLEYTGGPRNCYDCIDKYGAYYRFYESDLEPYTEPTDFGREVNFPTKNNLAIYLKKSKNCDMQFGNILKDSFLKEQRLNIATRVLCGMMADPISSNIQGKPTPVIVKWAYEIADALIAEVEKRSEHGK